MNPENVIEVDTSRLEAVMYDLQDALGTTGAPADASDVVRDETLRLIKELVKLTPPKTSAQGINAINRDNKSLFTPVSQGMIDTIGSQHGITGINAWITKKDGKPLNLKWDHIDPTGARMKEYHYRNLNKRGRAPKAYRSRDGEWRARTVVPIEANAAYLKNLRTHVGRMKASFAASAMALGETKVANWIRRHITSNATPKSITRLQGLMNGANPVVEFGSRAPSVSGLRHLYSSAVRIRAQAISRRVRLIVSGYNKDIAAGLKVGRKARSTNQGGRGVIG